MRCLLLALYAGAAVLGCAPTAFAVDVPKAGKSDPRVKWVNYDPWQVYRVVGTFRTATQIVFDPREEIQHVALGDTVSWEVAAETNILFVKPREKGTATNLIAGLQNANFVAFRTHANRGGQATKSGSYNNS